MPEELPAELLEHIGTSQANVSKHLKVLLDAGVVGRRADGTSAYYSIDDPSLVPLCALVCGRLREQVTEKYRNIAG